MAEKVFRPAPSTRRAREERELPGPSAASPPTDAQGQGTTDGTIEGRRRVVALKLPTGWVRAPERGMFYDTEGDLRTAFGRRNALAVEAGYRSYGEYRRVAADPHTGRHRLEYMALHDVPRWQTLGPGSDFGRAVANVRREAELVRTGVLGSFDPDGALADFLIDLGWRDPEDTWAPGDTPTEL